jgi:hypothetical protein
MIDLISNTILYTLSFIMISITALLFMLNYQYKKTLRRNKKNH